MARTAVVTGGASGIGRALSKQLISRGGTVLIADRNGEAAAQTADELTAIGPGKALPVELDVRDAAAVEAVVQGAYDDHGRLDLMVNNAGIAVGGPVEEMTLDHWNTIIDINLRGVVHGVHAAYPRMIERGSGQILNTASLAGLYAPPRMAPYSATKHAVVGLTLSLRAEAERHGVKVSVLCPGFTDTPLLDNGNPDLPQTADGRNVRAIATKIQGKLYDVDELAVDIVRGLATNAAVIVAPASARVTWRANRLAPALVRKAGAVFSARQR